ncbi:MAG: capsid protein [Cressdnaviricota sp.]|nr:MAG: capsid protein [Cressdnaviricota sp.]
MPAKSGYRKSTRKPRRRFKSRIGRVPRGIYPSTYKFKRAFTDVVTLSSVDTPPAGWSIVDNAMTTQMVFALEQLGDPADFSNLFRKYKIAGVKTQMYFTNTATKNDGFGSVYPAATQRVPQLMLYTNVNQTGRVNGTFTEQYFLNTQTARKRTIIHDNTRPITLYHRVKQLNRVYSSGQVAGDNDYALSDPKYVSTQDKTVEHYGYEMRIQHVSGDPWPAANSTTPVRMKLIHTFYFSCQGVE